MDKNCGVKIWTPGGKTHKDNGIWCAAEVQWKRNRYVKDINEKYMIQGSLPSQGDPFIFVFYVYALFVGTYVYFTNTERNKNKAKNAF
jgi:hypothetical protein